MQNHSNINDGSLGQTVSGFTGQDSETLAPLTGTQLNKDLPLELSHLSAALNYAERISPGVGTRVSWSDSIAIAQGVLRALNIGSLTAALIEVRVGPPTNLLHEVSKTLESMTQVQKTFVEKLKEVPKNPSVPSRVPNGRPRRDPAPPEKGRKPPVRANASAVATEGRGRVTVTASVEKPVESPKVSGDERLAASAAFKKAISSSEQSAEICRSLNIDDEVIDRYFRDVVSSDDLKVSEQDKSIPIIFRYGLITKDQFDSLSWADSVTAQSMKTHAKKRYYGASGMPTPTSFPTEESHGGRISFPVDMADSTARSEVLKRLCVGLHDSLSLSDDYKVFVAIGKKVQSIEPLVYNVKIKCNTGSGKERISTVYSSFFAIAYSDELSTHRAIFVSDPMRLADNSEGRCVGLPDSPVANKEESATTPAADVATTSACTTVGEDEGRNVPWNVVGPKLRKAAKEGSRTRAPASSSKNKLAPDKTPRGSGLPNRRPRAPSGGQDRT